MTCTPQLQTLLKDSAYKLTQFSDAQIQSLEKLSDVLAARWAIEDLILEREDEVLANV